MAAKSDTLQLHANIKATRQLHQSQLTKLHSKADDDAALFDSFRDFSKKRAEIEQDYAQRLEKLSKTYLQKKNLLNRKTSISKGKLISDGVTGSNNALQNKPQYTATSPVETDGSNNSLVSSPTSPTSPTAAGANRSTVIAFQTLLAETDKQAKARLAISEKFSSEFADVIKEFNKDKTISLKRNSEYVSGMQESLWKSYADLEKTRKAYEETEKDAEVAKAKYDDDVKRPNTALKKVTNIVKQRDSVTHSEHLRKKWKSAVNRLDNARNDYLLQIDSTNAQQNRYYTVDLPTAMKRIDGSYYSTFSGLMNRISTLETDYSTTLTTSMRAVVDSANKIDRDQESENFLQDQKANFAKPKPFNFDPVGSDEVKDLTLDEFSKIILSQKLTALLTRKALLDRDLSRKEKERSGVTQLVDGQKQTPDSGNTGSSTEQILELDYAVDAMKTELAQTEIQIERIKGHGVEVPEPVLPAEDPLQDPNLPQGRVQYDYEPLTEGEVSIREGEIVGIVESDKGGWTKVNSGGKIGHVPSSYIVSLSGGGGAGQGLKKKGFKSDVTQSQVLGASTAALSEAGLQSNNRVKALYDYSPTQADELSFKAGDEIEIQSRTIEGGDTENEWYLGKCLRTGRTGKFPSMFVESKAGMGTQETLNSTTMGSADVLPNSNGGDARAAPAPAPAPAERQTRDAGPAATTDERSKTKPRVKALYDYDKTCEGEMTFRKGDIIEVIDTSISQDWWEGLNTRTSEAGQFPTAYIQDLAAEDDPTTSSSIETPDAVTATASFDYAGQVEGELSFAAGDVIKIISKNVEGDNSGGWWLGELNGQVGQIPASYLNST